MQNHLDHLGSSSYITNLAGEITQHMEYLPFGETLIEEHLNSNNSPYKFNAKEFDSETGNYYYGARYYDPKFSIWLSVDPLAEKYPGWSPYNYTLQNPVRFVDPDGRSPFDHYFSSNGRYLGSDNRSTNNIRVMQNSYGSSGVFITGSFNAEYAYNNSTNLSSFNYSDKQNVSILKNVASYYQAKVGLSANGPMDVRDSNSSVMHVVGDGPEINVSRQFGAGISQFLDDANNFMNTIVHEDGHRRDDPLSSFKHTANYSTQSQDGTWLNTTTDFKNAMSSNAANLLNSSIEQGTSSQDIQSRVDEFNAIPGGIQLNYNQNTNKVVPVTQLEPVIMNNN